MAGKDNQNTVDQIFWDALQITGTDQQRAYLDQVCQENPGLRQQIETLLDAHQQAEQFLEQPVHLIGLEPADSAALPDCNVTVTGAGGQAASPPDGREKFPRPFGEYTLLDILAHGGMGKVYLAEQPALNRRIAIKTILSGQFASEDEIRRFRIEAESAAQLDHSGIVPVFDVGCVQGKHYLAMGLVEGDSLASYILKGPLAPDRAASLVRKIAQAIQAAHDLGIIHRDLKPENVLVDESGVPRVTDFGLAKRVDVDSDLTVTGMVLGTPRYMSPEQATGNPGQISTVSDIWSLGAILYALLTGKPPFDGASQAETLLRVVSDHPVPPRRINPAIPRDLEAICLKCLEKNPADRYRTASDLAADLDRFLAREPILARSDLARHFRNWTLREPVLASQLAALAVIMLIIPVNFVLFGQDHSSRQLLLINETLLLMWALSAVIMQKIHNRITSHNVIPVVWAASNPLFLTTILYVNGQPLEILFSLYLLLMITMGFFRRIELIGITTAGCLAGYLSLQVVAPNPDLPDSYKVIFGVVLMVGGLLLGLQVLRLRRLARKNDSG